MRDIINVGADTYTGLNAGKLFNDFQREMFRLHVDNSIVRYSIQIIKHSTRDYRNTMIYHAKYSRTIDGDLQIGHVYFYYNYRESSLAVFHLFQEDSERGILVFPLNDTYVQQNPVNSFREWFQIAMTPPLQDRSLKFQEWCRSQQAMDNDFWSQDLFSQHTSLY